MFFQLNREELIRRDFILVEEKHVEEYRSLKQKMFIQKGEDIFYVKDVHPLNIIICPIIPNTADDQEFMKRILLFYSRESPILVKNNNDIIGYIDATSCLSQLYDNYERLYVFFQTAVDTIDASCTIIDKDMRVLLWTREAEKIFSIPKEDILGRKITDFFHRNDLEIITTLEKGSSEYQKQHQARENLIVLINSNPVRLNDEIIGAVVSETDITSQVRLNRELFHISEKVIQLEKKIEAISEQNDPFLPIRGNSVALQETISKAKKAATTLANILILGESGVGKELFAKAIHDLREHKNAPFIPINCGAIPAALFESELFGYERGAFSGADSKGKKGKIELAHNGTLFLDEIGEMPLDMQVKLLRVLQEKRYFPIGGTKEIEVDFRVIAATNRDLLKMVEEGKFREDLFYRLNVVSLEIPPLRKRPEDVIELTHYFLYEFSVRYNRPIHGISQEVMHALLQYHWPGNIRELRNVIERLVVFSEDGKLNIRDLPFYKGDSQPAKLWQFDDQKTLSERLEQVERDIILRELEKAKGNKQLCAQNLGISRATLYNRMNKLGIYG